MLNNEQIVNHLKSAIELLETTQFDEFTILRNLEEWDSLSAMSIIAMLHQEFGLIIGAEQINSFVTVGDILNYVQLNGK